jgi:hypothetical protein
VAAERVIVLVLAAGVACGPAPRPRAPDPIEPPPPEPPRASVEPAPEPARVCERLPIAVLGLEARPGARGQIDPQDTAVASGVTKYLRREAREDRCYVFVPGGDRELIDEKLINGCDDETPTCMAKIGENLHVAHLMFGNVQRQGPMYRIELALIDVRTQIVQSWQRTMTSADADQEAVARAGYEALAHRVE